MKLLNTIMFLFLCCIILLQNCYASKTPNHNIKRIKIEMAIKRKHQNRLIANIKNIMNHKLVSVQRHMEFPIAMCECGTQLRHATTVKLGREYGSSCGATVEYVYQHLARMGMCFGITKVRYPFESRNYQIKRRNRMCAFNSFEKLKLFMGNPELDLMICDVEDEINDHNFLILKIAGEFTLLHSWIDYWDLESWLGDEKQFPNFFFGGGPNTKCKNMSEDALRKMQQFHQDMGKGQFFSLETFWSLFETNYINFISAQALSISNTKTIDENTPAEISIRNFIEIGEGDVWVCNQSQIKTQYVLQDYGIQLSKL